MNPPFNIVLMLLYDFSQIRSNKKHFYWHSFSYSANSKEISTTSNFLSDYFLHNISKTKRENSLFEPIWYQINDRLHLRGLEQYSHVN